MNNINLINSIGIIIVFLMVLLSVFLFTVKSEKKLSNQLFAFFLLITAFDLAGLFLGDIINPFPNILILKISSSLLQMPLFYLYVLSVCYADFRIKPQHIVHAILFFAFLFSFKLTSLSNQSFLYFQIVGEIQFYTYIVFILLALKKYKKIYLENYSNPNYPAYKWLFQVTLLFVIAHIFVLIKIGLSFIHKSQATLDGINTLISMNALLVICWFVLKALYNPQIFKGVNIDLLPIKPNNGHPTPEIKDEALINKSIQNLTSFMACEKPYLDFDLTLQKLSFLFHMPERELSTLINRNIGQHFFDFINEYRINEAKLILANPDKKEETILEILYQVGFSSKSSFYTAFKKSTTQTPAQYRKVYLAK